MKNWLHICNLVTTRHVYIAGVFYKILCGPFNGNATAHVLNQFNQFSFAKSDIGKKMWTIQFNIAICSCFQIGFLCTRQIYGSKTARIRAKKLVLSILKIELKNFRIKNIECDRLQIKNIVDKVALFHSWKNMTTNKKQKYVFFKKIRNNWIHHPSMQSCS